QNSQIFLIIKDLSSGIFKLYRVDIMLENMEEMYSGNLPELYCFVNNDNGLAVWGAESGCFNMYSVDLQSPNPELLFSCFGTSQSLDGNRAWKWNDYYITTIGESKWIYTQTGNPIDTA